MFAANVASADNVANVFGDGVFDAPWLSNMTEIEKLHPGGKLVREVGSIQYRIKDDRSLFSLPRNKKNTISFFFNPNDELIGVNIEFPAKRSDGFGELMAKLTSIFGKPIPHAGDYAVVNWADDDDDELSLSLLFIPVTFNSKLIVSVQHHPDPEPVSKEELGL